MIVCVQVRLEPEVWQQGGVGPEGAPGRKVKKVFRLEEKSGEEGKKKGGGLFSQLLWHPACSAREAMLLVQKANQAYTAALAQRKLSSAHTHFVVLLRLPPPASATPTAPAMLWIQRSVQVFDMEAGDNTYEISK